MKKILIPFALLLLALTACGSKPCSEQAAEYLDQSQDMLERWDDANAIAGSTARMSLAGPLADLQEIRRDADDLEHPECANEVHDSMINFMDLTIDSYLSFMSDDGQAENKIRRANDALDDYFAALLAIDGEAEGE